MYMRKRSGILIGLGTALLLATAPSAAQWIPDKTLHVANARNLSFCEIVPMERGAPLVYVYNTIGNNGCSRVLSDLVDTKSLAAKLGAESVLLNSKRRWLQDQLWIYRLGETKDFGGLKATMMASVEPFFLREAMKAHFSPIYLSRWTKSVYEKGRPIFLMRSPSGKAWVMQSYTTYVDESLTIDTLVHLRVQLSVPPGWRFETKIL